MKKDAFYFPHFSNARHDRKIKRVRKELGPEGYGIFFMILEVLREQSDYRFPIEDLDLLADEFGTSEQKVRTVVCNYDLFHVDIENHFFSSNLIMFLQPFFEGKEKRRIAGIKGNLIKHGHYKSEELKGKTDKDILLLAKELKGFSQCERIAIPDLSQMLAKESKQSKANQTVINTPYNPQNSGPFETYDKGDNQ